MPAQTKANQAKLAEHRQRRQLQGGRGEGDCTPEHNELGPNSQGIWREGEGVREKGGEVCMPEHSAGESDGARAREIHEGLFARAQRTPNGARAHKEGRVREGVTGREGEGTGKGMGGARGGMLWGWRGSG